ncbi:hypothetical protein SAMN04489729_0822 [Amycolatopsis lurida]|uniref:Uncharacterized protein n=1 Tax=Amycolatopsis lurida NRRL 2430 TaxID=1460371 RepID=A0A2P2FM32_AMYLU|nr:hypothetical protein [Amycolatopsis lurida]KFU77785.1 hypothetical protein BB31_29405 [Amycolatopsis lurida NRRL 2430]SEB38933.1 hypothetical protein SAMN04489729_0822 [Amycolatopsis lurida]
MARDHARLDLNIWDKDDFRALSREAKLLYIQLFSQRKLSYAGVLDLAVKRWNRPHADLDLTEMRAALSELDAARFVVIDQDTEELLVRSFIRSDELYKQPNMLRGALRVAFDIESPILRAALAAELRRLPAHVTGPAPAIAANELEAGAPELPPVVKAAMTVRPSGRPSPAGRPPRQDGASEPDSGGAITPGIDQPAPSSRGSANPSATPSLNPSAKDLGEGSRERETGEPSFASRSEKAGLPARDAHDTRATRVPAATSSAQEDSPGDSAGAAPPGSVRRRRRAEAERLVDFYGSPVPAPVRAQLVAQVIPLLREGIGSNTIGAGLAAWSSKALPPTFLPMLVGERMRAARIATDPKKRAWDAEMVDRFESLRSAAIAEDEQHGVGLLVRQAQPQHADADQLTAILDAALDQATA